MAIYSVDGDVLSNAYDVNGNQLLNAYDIDGNLVYSSGSGVDYTSYSYVQKWASKGISSTQGFAIHDDKVFWVSKSGNSSIPANCYVWNLSDGSQALNSQPITIQSGHGNNLSFDYPILYATTAYNPPYVYVNRLTSDYVATLEKTLYMNDGSDNCDACVDEQDKTVLWTIGHTDRNVYLVSKWNLNNLTDNGDGTYTPELLQTVETPLTQSFYFQGCTSHDGLLWYANGYAGSSIAYVFAINPNTGAIVYTINCETTEEPEGVEFYPDPDAIGGYAMYVGFQGMMLRKYTFGAL